jgi:hypothetical protein
VVDPPAEIPFTGFDVTVKSDTLVPPMLTYGDGPVRNKSAVPKF